MSYEMYSIDRIEENYIILIDSLGNTKNITKNDLTFDVKEGDILIKNANGYKISDDKFKCREEFIRNKVKGMWEE